MTSLEQALGTEHISVAVMASNLSAIETEVGEFSGAVADASRSLAIYERAAARGEISNKTLGMGSALANEGDALSRLGRRGEAAEKWERAHAIFGANDAKSRVASVTISLADAQRALGHANEASRLAAEARRLVTALGLESDTELAAKLFTLEGALELDAGRAANAVVHAERAGTLAESGHASLYVLATARLLLARALLAGKGDAARARAAAESAREGFAQVHDDALADEARSVAAHGER